MRIEKRVRSIYYGIIILYYVCTTCVHRRSDGPAATIQSGRTRTRGPPIPLHTRIFTLKYTYIKRHTYENIHYTHIHNLPFSLSLSLSHTHTYIHKHMFHFPCPRNTRTTWLMDTHIYIRRRAYEYASMWYAYIIHHDLPICARQTIVLTIFVVDSFFIMFSTELYIKIKYKLVAWYAKVKNHIFI